MKFAQRTASMLLVFIINGCVSTEAYFKDRGRDALDIFTITAGAGAGARARIGPIHAGLGMYSDVIGLRGGHAFLAGPGDLAADGEAPFPIIPMRCNFVSYAEEFYPRGGKFESHILVKRNKAFDTWGDYPFYTSKVWRSCGIASNGKEVGTGNYWFNPYWTQIDAWCSAGGGCRIGLNPGELADFMFGFFRVDMFDDDINSKILSGKAAQVVKTGQGR